MKTRLLQVGLGGWGQDWNKYILQPYTDVELVGFVDMDAATLAKASAALGLPDERCFNTLDAALGAVEVDAVLVTANLVAHVPVARAALLAGKHVLVEKPFAATVEEAQQLVELAEQRGLVLMVSQNYRFFPAAQAVAALLRAGTLGPVGSVAIDFRRYANGAPVEGNRHYALPHPLLMDMSIHHFDLMRFVLGQEAKSVACSVWNPPWSHFTQPPEAAATITFADGAVVSYRGSWISNGPPTPWAGEWRIECRDGAVSWTGRADRGTGADAASITLIGKKPRALELPAVQHFDRSGTLHAFVQAIETGSVPSSTGRDNLGTLALMNATIAAAETGSTVYLP